MSLILEDVAPAPAPAPAPPAPLGAPQADWTVVRGSLAAIESARTQVDVLSRFLTRVNAHASRVALLVVRNERLTGWKSVGFDASGGRDEAVRALDIGTNDDPFVAAVLKAQRSMLAEPPDESAPLRRALSGQAPSRTLLVPMVIRDRFAGIVCADELPGEDGRLNEAAVEVLTFVTGLAVDLLAARKKIPSPSLTPTGEAIARFDSSVSSPRAAARGFETEAAPALVAPPAKPAAPSAPAPPPLSAVVPRPKPTDAGEALRAIEEMGKLRVPPAARSFSSDPGLTGAIRTGGFPAAAPLPAPAAAASSQPVSQAVSAVPAPSPHAPPPAPPVPQAAPPISLSSMASPLANASTGDFTGAFEALRSSGRVPSMPVEGDTAAPKPKRPTSAVMPPRDLAGLPRPISGFVPRGRAALADNPQRALDDARRLARLLISEIKLYNEKKVEEGRAKGDLYERLKDDIERSRQVYDERTPAAVRKETNFFHDEIVRILADGRADALGSVS
jgi:hypothetical protein